MAKLAFSCQKSISATLWNLAGCALGQCFQTEHFSSNQIISSFPHGISKFFLFWVTGIILKGWEAESEMGVVIGI